MPVSPKRGTPPAPVVAAADADLDALQAEVDALEAAPDPYPTYTTTAEATAASAAAVATHEGAFNHGAFTGGDGSPGTAGMVPAPAAGDAAAGKHLGADATWHFPPSGQHTLYLDPSDDSDLPGYKTARTTPSTAAETTLAASLAGVADTLLASFATDPGVPGVLLLPPGTAARRIYARTAASNQVARLKIELYTAAADGSGETLRRSNYTDDFSGATIQGLYSDVTDPVGYAMLATDRIVVKVYAARVSGPAACDVTVYFDGAEHPSYVITTITDAPPAAHQHAASAITSGLLAMARGGLGFDPTGGAEGRVVGISGGVLALIVASTFLAFTGSIAYLALQGGVSDTPVLVGGAAGGSIA